jgi:hypothetical protein
MKEVTHMTTENIQDREHSSIVGGSNAGRMIGCPAHYGIIQRMQAQLDGEADELIKVAGSTFKVGEPGYDVAVKNANELRGSLNKSSSYADEGTALHTIMEYLVDNDIPMEGIENHPQVVDWFENGVELSDGTMWELHPDRMHDAMIPAYQQFTAFLDEVLAEDGDEFLLSVECVVHMPGIDGAFGTTDVLIRTSKRTIVWDWKFGAGVPVYASYTITPAASSLERMMSDTFKEPEPETFGNDQLCFYGRASMHSKPEYFDVDNPDWPVELVICQPRVRDEISRYSTTVGELEDFHADLLDAVTEALESENPTIKKGKWCDFAPCKTQCPLHAGSVPAMAKLGDKLRQLKASQEGLPAPGEHAVVDTENGGTMSYPVALSIMLDLAELAEPYFKEAQAQAHAFLEAGGKIPGRKLVPKRAGHDGWLDPKDVDSFLGRRGLDTAQRREPWVPITPAVARKKLKAIKDDKGLKLLEKYVSPGVSSGTNVARSDDPRPEVLSNAETIGNLADKLRLSLEQN